MPVSREGKFTAHPIKRYIISARDWSAKIFWIESSFNQLCLPCWYFWRRRSCVTHAQSPVCFWGKKLKFPGLTSHPYPESRTIPHRMVPCFVSPSLTDAPRTLEWNELYKAPAFSVAFLCCTSHSLLPLDQFYSCCLSPLLAFLLFLVFFPAQFWPVKDLGGGVRCRTPPDQSCSDCWVAWGGRHECVIRAMLWTDGATEERERYSNYLKKKQA